VNRGLTVYSNTFNVVFEVLTVVLMKSSILWDITLCSPLKVNQRFGAICRLRLRGQSRSQREARDKHSNGLHSVISQMI
jgi:hypothetical protein